jgi:hypothetical protein
VRTYWHHQKAQRYRERKAKGMALINSKLRDRKLTDGRDGFGSNWWTAERMSEFLGVQRVTLNKWLHGWLVTGVVEREKISRGNNFTRGAAWYRYRFSDHSPAPTKR